MSQKTRSPLYIFDVQKDYSVDWKAIYANHTNIHRCLVLPRSIAQMCKVILNSVLDLPLKLEYWIHPFAEMQILFLYLLQGNCKQNARVLLPVGICKW